MTFRVLGLPDELRLELEQAGIPTEAAKLIIEKSVNDATDILNAAIREVQEVVGPHGAVSRLQAGGIRIARDGMGVFADGVLKTTILQDGNLFVGSNIDSSATTTMCVFVNDQVYNGEIMGAGDLLVGDNSAANMKYDASMGQLQFRTGRTVTAYVDTDGSIKFGTGTGWLDDGGIQLVSEGLLVLSNGYKFVDNADETKIMGGVYQIVRHSPNNDAYTELRAQTQDNTLATIYASVDSVAPTTAIARLTADSGGNAGAAAELRVTQSASTATITSENVNTLNFGTAIVDNDEKRLEVGADHYIPKRDAANPNVIFNEANQDIDFTVETVNSNTTLKIDAGLDAIGIGGAADGSYKLTITGDLNLTGWPYVDGARLPQFLPFAAYANSPWNNATSPAYVYSCTLDRTITFAKWSQAVIIPSGTSDGSNYWTISLYTLSGTLINQMNTSTCTSGAWKLLTDSTWTSGSAGVTDIGLYIQVDKVNSPGNITLFSPMIEVYW